MSGDRRKHEEISPGITPEHVWHPVPRHQVERRTTPDRRVADGERRADLGEPEKDDAAARLAGGTRNGPDPRGTGITQERES